VTLGSGVSTGDLIGQMEETGIEHALILPFPSTAIRSNEINIRLLDETKRVERLLPYFYIREDFPLIPHGYYGGKWHWMRGIQDSASNYKVLEEKVLPRVIEGLTRIGKPVLFEEELAFTEQFVRMAPDLPLIIPHLGLLGGNPLDFLRSFKDNPHIYFDTALSTAGTILQFLETIGPERIIFGSDVPFGSMATELPKVISLPIPDHEKALVLAGNIIKLAKLPLQSTMPSSTPTGSFHPLSP
jgi:predicted TIM-barrel fold metal-dependent hydrolase